MTGAELIEWRKGRGESQAQAAKLIGVGRTHLSRLENAPDDDVPRLIALAVIAVNYLNGTPIGRRLFETTEDFLSRTIGAAK